MERELDDLVSTAISHGIPFEKVLEKLQEVWVEKLHEEANRVNRLRIEAKRPG